eukprot:CAMPEP_0170457138 /NCGR_PEP_ID=MMETSP0123-20130129/4527_1 /TAXON_ID=182087 /ORGANISM="Favella ehrenbergii, Strain Fehren 1" /LENGTH=86 /DNA_ID=CAMNT_0010720825 /DNA_START=1157 /DNA_END=1417 /DNA_ORIENTATION=-
MEDHDLTLERHARGEVYTVSHMQEEASLNNRGSKLSAKDQPAEPNEAIPKNGEGQEKRDCVITSTEPLDLEQIRKIGAVKDSSRHA